MFFIWKSAARGGVKDPDFGSHLLALEAEAPDSILHLFTELEPFGLGDVSGWDAPHSVFRGRKITEEKLESPCLPTAAGFVGVFGEVVQQGKEC